MPPFCALYGLTPGQFRELSVADFNAMARYMNKALKDR